MIEPSWAARPITPEELLAVLHRQPVPGLNEHHPIVAAIRRCTLGNAARQAFTEARARGYLLLIRGSYGTFTQANTKANHAEGHLLSIWGWWCLATRQPEIVVDRPRSGGVRLRCDLAPTGRTWPLHAFPSIARLVGDLVPIEPGGWLFSPDLLEIDGLDLDSAVGVARALVASHAKASAYRITASPGAN